MAGVSQSAHRSSRHGRTLVDTSRTILVLAAALLAPTVVAAQGGGRQAEIPAIYRPPAGLCRIWVDNVPPAKQPAPTDCATALKNKPANGRVVFGETKPPGATRTGPLPPVTMMRGAAVLPGRSIALPLRGDSLRGDSIRSDSLRRSRDTTRADTTRDSTRVRRDTTGGGSASTS